MYKIANWLDYQHYGDKKQVPWIKLHFRILTSESWMMLDDSHKCLMITCMLHASENKGSITKSIDYIKNLGRIKGNVSFKQLVDIGFLIVKPSLDNSIENQNESSLSSSLSYSDSISEKGVKGEKQKDEFDLPDIIPKKDWDDYIEMRRIMKKIVTQRAGEILIKKLTDWFQAGHSPSEILQNSISNNWQGLFEPKGKNNGNSTSTRNETSGLWNGRYTGSIGSPSIHQGSLAATEARRRITADAIARRERAKYTAELDGKLEA